MVRSLRATGCNLPVRVIPYDEARFDLPPGCQWLEHPELWRWLSGHRAPALMRKYHCLLLANYQFVDADVCFLRNPAEALEPHRGFVTCCGHWHNPGDTVTPDSLRFLQQRSTVWQSSVFNAGQFACDVRLCSLDELRARAELPEFRQACLEWQFHEQPGLNQLVASSGVEVTNLTLPPHRMQSTWAGDYSGEDYRRYWTTETETPYLIHWAGVNMSVPRPIDQIFCSRLTEAEKAEWRQQVQRKREGKVSASVRRVKAGARAALRTWAKP
jgi:hypothetical protein